MKHSVAANKPVRRKGVTIAAAALSVALVAPFAQSVAYPELTASANAQPGSTPSRVVETLKVNPPTYYANSFGRNSEVKLGGGNTVGPRTVRLTGILSLPDTEEYEDIETFFPKGTKFEPQRLDWEFTSPGWYGVSRVDESDPEKLRGTTSEMISKAGAPGSNRKQWPYVVPETGQVIFGLQHQDRTAGTTERVPLRARWTDPNTGKNYVWNFEQEIVVGIGRAPAPKAPGDGEVVIQRHSQAEILEKLIEPTPDIRNSAGRLGSFVFGTEKTAPGSNFGLYKGPRGDLLETAKKELGDDFSELPGKSEGTYKKSDLPAAQTNHYAFKYAPVKGATESGEPQFHVEGKPEEVVTFRRDGGANSPHPAGAKFSIDGQLPEGAQGAEINAETGVVTLAKPVNEEVSIPVKVTYDDGTEDKSSVVFIPADKKLNDTVEPSYTKPGEGKLQSEAPIFHPQEDSDSVVDKPENTRFELG